MADPMPYPTPTSAAATAVMKGNRRRDTRPETRVRSLLHAQGWRFRKDAPIQLPGLRVRPDIVFTRRRVAVFIDGCFWHACPQHGTIPRANSAYWHAKLARNTDRDHRVNHALAEAGWIVIRAWEHEPAASVVDRVLHVLGCRSPTDRRTQPADTATASATGL